MDLNCSNVSSVHSSDTDILIKIPNNFFDPNLVIDKSQNNDFMMELDNFLHVEGSKVRHNSTLNDALSYNGFAIPLNPSSSSDKTDHQLKVQEENCYEQLTTILQKKIQQYQQKMAFLIKLDEEKNQVLHKLRNNEGLDIENNRLKQKIVNLEQEVAETIHLINKFQSKNELLELKIESLTQASAEIRAISKTQISEIEVRLSNQKIIEKELRSELDELKVTCKTEKDNFIKEKHARSVQDREIFTLKSNLKQAKEEKAKICERHVKEKLNIDLKQKKIFANMMEDFAEKERKLIKELDVQRTSLKNYYQAQLESALEEKVAEFQEQLENFHEEIKREAEKRERNHNERAINQMEMIVRKNEEEINLIQLKCTEEVELYKVQLFNATRTIESLESKLNFFQTRRNDLAANIHKIMETQWRKTLEILTNPSKLKDYTDLLSIEVSESDNNKQFQQAETMNNLSNSEENLKEDLLRNYIDMLLKQSPKEESNCSERNSHRNTSRNLKPWK